MSQLKNANLCLRMHDSLDQNLPAPLAVFSRLRGTSSFKQILLVDAVSCTPCLTLGLQISCQEQQSKVEFCITWFLSFISYWHCRDPWGICSYFYNVTMFDVLASGLKRLQKQHFLLNSSTWNAAIVVVVVFLWVQSHIFLMQDQPFWSTIAEASHTNDHTNWVITVPSKCSPLLLMLLAWVLPSFSFQLQEQWEAIP